jgi:hypothetical protein
VAGDRRSVRIDVEPFDADPYQPRQCTAPEMAWIAHVVQHYPATAYGDPANFDAGELRAEVLAELRVYGIEDPTEFMAALAERR